MENGGKEETLSFISNMDRIFSDKEITGESGEHFVTGMLMTGSVFFAKLFGGKMPRFDIYAEVNDGDTPFPLYIQVKATQKKKQKYNKTSINTSVPEHTIKELAAMPIPTYVAGYDLEDHKLFLAPVFSGKEKYPSIPLTHKIELGNKAEAIIELERLRDDVVNFFRNKMVNYQNYKHTYISQL